MASWGSFSLPGTQLLTGSASAVGGTLGVPTMGELTGKDAATALRRRQARRMAEEEEQARRERREGLIRADEEARALMARRRGRAATILAGGRPAMPAAKTLLGS